MASPSDHFHGLQSLELTTFLIRYILTCLLLCSVQFCCQFGVKMAEETVAAITCISEWGGDDVLLRMVALYVHVQDEDQHGRLLATPSLTFFQPPLPTYQGGV
jgi:hypothetical protein